MSLDTLLVRPIRQYIISELELVMEEHVTVCNQSCDFLSKIKLMSFVNIDFW